MLFLFPQVLSIADCSDGDYNFFFSFLQKQLRDDYLLEAPALPINDCNGVQLHVRYYKNEQNVFYHLYAPYPYCSQNSLYLPTEDHTGQLILMEKGTQFGM